MTRDGGGVPEAVSYTCPLKLSVRMLYGVPMGTDCGLPVGIGDARRYALPNSMTLFDFPCRCRPYRHQRSCPDDDSIIAGIA
jgi:hypothetical protein